jgi:2C-methyl-D-erythritol 2,4-cyclodiphosphate synthase
MDKTLKYDDLVKISNILSENGYNCSNVTIEIAVHTQKMLNRLNSDFFFRSGLGADKKVENVSEINISLNGVKFRYICDEKEEK